MDAEQSFVEIAAILILATILGIGGQKLRQPLLIVFLATGVMAGSYGLDIIGSHEKIELLAEMGISLLLFIVGLKLDLKLIRTTGPVSLATGLGQIIFTSVIGFGICLALGMSIISAAYVSVALTFSSTIIIVKLLSDKKEIDSLHGQIAIGFLIVQDIAAILALVGLTTLGASVGGGEDVVVTSIKIAAKGLGLLAVIALLMKYVLSNLTRRLANSPELLTLFAISWAVSVSASSELLGFSKELGAFLAGISLASTQYRDSIGARLTTLRDFMVLFFFIDLGARLDWSAVGSQIGASLLLSGFVLIGNPLIVLAIMGYMGYRRRTSFLAGLTVAQISEFSLIVAALGLSMGHISPETMGLVTFVGVLTIFASTYMILYSDSLYRFLSGPLKIFERKSVRLQSEAEDHGESDPVDVIIVGLGDYGGGLAAHLLLRGKSVFGVDFDPSVLDKWSARGIPVLFGDMGDPEMHEQLPLARAKWVLSTVRLEKLNLSLLEHLKSRNFRGKVALTATNSAEADDYEKHGAHLILRPFTDAMEQATDALAYAMDFLPENLDWPLAFLDARIRHDSSVAGLAIRDIPLRSIRGVSILAVTRAGQADFDPRPDLQIHPGDRLLIMGPPGQLREAEALLNKRNITTNHENSNRFEFAEVAVAHGSSLSEQTLAESGFRQKYGVTIVGIRRGEHQITTVSPEEKILDGDRLIVIGTTGAVAGLRQAEPL